jgi:hypothetical protein
VEFIHDMLPVPYNLIKSHFGDAYLGSHGHYLY